MFIDTTVVSTEIYLSVPIWVGCCQNIHTPFHILSNYNQKKTHFALIRAATYLLYVSVSSLHT